MRRPSWAIIAAMVLLLSGCSDIPMSGAPQAGATDQPRNPNIVYYPQSPAQNASQQDIVNGFVQAASAGGRFTVAKQYLTTEAAAKWNPKTRILVTEQASTPTANGKNAITLKVPTSAQVNEAGVYTPSAQTEKLAFRLVQQNGQWRIDSAPNGITLAQQVFVSKYAPQTLQFFDPGYSRLVPEVRWLPSGVPPARAVVEALVSGPSGPLRSGVTRNALDGTTVRAVSTEQTGVTTVVLSAKGTPTVQTTDRMQQQLIRSLGLQGPSAMQLDVNGRIAPQSKTLAVPVVSQQPFVLTKQGFGTVAQSGVMTEERTLGKRIAALAPSEATVSVRQGLAAVAVGSTVQVVSSGAPRIVDRRPGLVAPTIDQLGWTYSVPRDEPTGLRAYHAKKPDVDVSADLSVVTNGASVASIEASPDGTRLLVLTNSPSGPAAFVAGIERGADGTPIALTRATNPVAVDPGTGLDITWVDDAYVAVLTLAVDGTTERVQVEQVGGLSQSLGPLSNAQSIVGTGAAITSDLSPVLAQLQGGQLQGWQSNAWQSPYANPVEVSVLAVQR